MKFHILVINLMQFIFKLNVIEFDLAIKNNNIEIVKLLVSTPNIDVNATSIIISFLNDITTQTFKLY